MTALLISLALVIGVTAVAAIVSLRWRPARGTGFHVLVASAVFPVIAVLAFAAMTAFTLAGASTDAPGAAANVGMPIFALGFFLLYALALAVVVGLPTAFVTVRLLRR